MITVVPTYALLELEQIRWAQRIGLRDDRDQVDAGAELLHDLNVERLECVASGADEVQASVDTEVDLVSTTGLLLLQHVGFMLIVEKFDDGLPRVAVVHVVAEAGGVNDSEAD